MKTIILATIAVLTLTGCGRELVSVNDCRGEFIVDEQTITVRDRSIKVTEYRAEPVIDFRITDDGYEATTDSGWQKTTDWRWYQTEGGQWMLERVPEPVKVSRGFDQGGYMHGPVGADR